MIKEMKFAQNAALSNMGGEGRIATGAVDLEMCGLLYHDKDGVVDRSHSGYYLQQAKPGGKNTKSTQHQYLKEFTATAPPTLDPSHIVLSHRRYNVCISDLKCILNVNGMARHFASLPVVVTGKHKGHFVSITARANLGERCEQNQDCGALDDWIRVRISCILSGFIMQNRLYV